jgi:hypothetical protein
LALSQVCVSITSAADAGPSDTFTGCEGGDLLLRVTTTVDAVRLLAEWARRADASLARSAARNAAHSMNAVRVRELDDARTLRDLERIPAAGRRQLELDALHASGVR